HNVEVAMAQSFTTNDDSPLARIEHKPRKVLVTGASGNIGSYFAEHSHTRYDLRLMVRPKSDEQKVRKLRDFGEVVAAELHELDKLIDLCDGIDTVLHLAA